MKTQRSSFDTPECPVVVELAGGLGNQLFQCAFGQYVHAVTKRPVLYDCTAVKRDVKRALLVTAFDIDAGLFVYSRKTLFSILGARVHTSLSITEKLIHRVIPRKSPHALKNMLFIDDDVLFAQHVRAPQDIVRYMAHLCSLIKDSAHVPVYCRGYWQYVYVALQNKKMGVPQLYYKGMFGDSVRDLLHTLVAQKHVSCSLHIRRGDYLVPSIDNILPRITREYYRRAVDLILKANPSTHFYVFSDDAPWCNAFLVSMLGKHVPLTVVSDTISNTPVEDMILMNCCHNKILANSSFSWWGAQLPDVVSSHPQVSCFQEGGAKSHANPKMKEKYTDTAPPIIIAPALWFTHTIKNNLIVPALWQRL